MAQKNEAPILALALVLTLGLIGGGLWVFQEPLRNLLGQSSRAAPATSSNNNSLNSTQTNSASTAPQTPLSTNSAAVDYSAIA
ncbi:MAG: hypothetical protein QNJ46_15015 [Leptolyngbyaceae cyanobacterium MO_188.B28]|nr:hypothetical protein [Leptolyngbyaceae cyanobacterium MO_188.B28]